MRYDGSRFALCIGWNGPIPGAECYGSLSRGLAGAIIPVIEEMELSDDR